jgi:hypothetical protein
MGFLIILAARPSVWTAAVATRINPTFKNPATFAGLSVPTRRGLSKPGRPRSEADGEGEMIGRQ